MKLKNRILNLSLLLLLSAPQTVEAKFAYPELVKVPIPRLLTNLQKRLNDPKSNLSQQERAELNFRIGRLNSMAYAYNANEVQVRKAEGDLVAEGKATPFYGVGMREFQQFEVSDTKHDATAKAYLKEAVKYLREALKLDPSMSQARLGLAWCLDQSGDKANAIPLYRQVYKESYEKEKNQKGMRGTSICMETAGYLEKLLNPVKDAAEIAKMKEQTENINLSFRTVTPIMIPLVANLSLRDFTQPASLVFDLDGNGPKHYGQWTGPKAGWLVYDAANSKKITSGLQLFGPSSFWIFWNDGYEAMKALDDNNDGKLSGTELNGLAVWCDSNRNGQSEPDEVKRLAELGIKALSCQGHLNAEGTMLSINGVTFADGSTADSYDIVLDQIP